MVEVTKEATLHRDDDDAGVIGVGASGGDEKLLFAKEGHTRVNFRIFFQKSTTMKVISMHSRFFSLDPALDIKCAMTDGA